MNGVQGNQAAQVRMFAHDAIPVALGAINPEFGITLDSGGYGYAVGNEIILNTVSGTDPAKIKVTSIGSSDIINVQAVTSSPFFFNGVQLIGSKKLILKRGETYTFYQKATSNLNHPLLFSTDSDNEVPYTDGVSSPGVAGSTKVVTWTVASNAPNTLYYYCGNHASMNGGIEIIDSGTEFLDAYPNNNAVKSFEVIRQAGGKPFGKAYTVGFKVQPGTETYLTSQPSAFIGSVSSIDLASTDQRGACIYVGVKMSSMTAKMESGKLATFKDVAAGSFMPILVKQITTATPDGGSAGVISDNDIIALY
jgi:hypothetical protein